MNALETRVSTRSLKIGAGCTLNLAKNCAYYIFFKKINVACFSYTNAYKHRTRPMSFDPVMHI